MPIGLQCYSIYTSIAMSMPGNTLVLRKRRDEDIAVDVVERALLQKYVGFIEKVT